jgi:hypothetical protein
MEAPCVRDNVRVSATGPLQTIVERRGYLDGAALQTFFAWLRPNDLIWGYVANNYLLGRTPPAFDILFWNSDTTRMAAALLRDLADMAVSNALCEPGEMDLLGTPIDLGRVGCDAYVVAGVADHITPWENCYATTQLLGGATRFMLSSAGHVAALVNPPGNPQGAVPHGAGGGEPAVRARLGRGGGGACGQLVGRLGCLARRALGCRAAGAAAARWARVRRCGSRAGRVRVGELSAGRELRSPLSRPAGPCRG